MKEKEIIPNGWKKVKFSDLLNYEQPYLYEVENENYEDFGIPVLTAGKSFILGYTNEEKGIYEKGSVVIFDDFTTDSKYVDFPFKVKSSAMKFLTAKNNSPETLFLLYNYLQIKRISEVKEHKRQWLSEFSKYTFSFPTSLDEQKAIAGLLSKMDDAIEKTKCLIKKYTDIKTGLMHDLLSCGIDKNGKLRSEKTHQFKDSPLGKIPKEWDVVELGKVAESIADGDHMPPPKVETGIPFITITNLTNDNKIDFSSTMFVPLWYYENLDDKRKPKKNDILYSVVGSLGIPVLVSGDSQFVFQRHIAIIRPNLKEIIPDFLYTMMSSFSFFIQADFAAVGIAQRTISLSSLKKLSFAKPDISEQKEILNRLEPITKLIQSEQKTLENLIAQKQGLMKDLLTGRVRVKI